MGRGPATEIFREFDGHFPHLPVIVEDLGTITADVREVVRNFGLPGMKVLMFAFGDDNPLHPYKPHNYEPNCVVYTGTHDTNTAKGWFEHETNGEILHRLNQYLGKTDVAGRGVLGSHQAGHGFGGQTRHRPRSGIVEPGRGQPHEHPRHYRWQLALAPASGATRRCPGGEAKDRYGDVRPGLACVSALGRIKSSLAQNIISYQDLNFVRYVLPCQ